jgi:alpha-glucosidase
MPWSSTEPNLGFSTGKPWLPAGEAHGMLAVDAQEENPRSILAFTRECLLLRHSHPAMRLGSMAVIEAGDQLLIFERSAGGERLRCSFNLSDRPVSFAPTGTRLLAAGEMDGTTLGPYAAIVEEIE